jgi:hypothetical protein
VHVNGIEIPGSRNVIKKEAEIQRLWNVKATEILVIIVATGTISKSLRQHLSIGLPYVLIFPDMSSFSRLKLPSGRNL